MKCKCFGCSNESHQGGFTGEFCNPCYHYITTGKIGPTDSFLDGLVKPKELSDEEIDKLADEYLSDYFDMNDTIKFARAVVKKASKI